MSIRTDAVLLFFAAFHAQDSPAARALVATDFHFTSPQDDHLDRETYFDVCFPTASHFVEQRMLELTEVGDTVLSRYEYELADGTRWRNMEAHTVDAAGMIHEVQVYFGGQVGGPK
jgi:ketosteroid isomerase-like protein